MQTPKRLSHNPAWWLAGVMVPRFNDECIYPCEPPATGC